MTARMLTRCRRRDLTLIEMVISLSMLTVILAGSISLVLIAARAMSNESSNVGADAVARDPPPTRSLTT